MDEHYWNKGMTRSIDQIEAKIVYYQSLDADLLDKEITCPAEMRNAMQDHSLLTCLVAMYPNKMEMVN